MDGKILVKQVTVGEPDRHTKTYTQTRILVQTENHAHKQTRTHTDRHVYIQTRTQTRTHPDRYTDVHRHPHLVSI